MTLSLLINGVDYTSRWRPYESRWTTRGHMLESMQSEFVLDDFAGDLDISDVRPRKVVEVWEDASGSPVCLYRGRIASKTLGRGPLRTNPAMRWRIMAEDPNVEVRGIRIVSFNRDAELDTTRVEVLRLAYLNGASSLNPHARDSTTLGGTYIQADSTTTLDPDHYTDTYPDQLLLQVAEDAGKQVFVYLEDDGTMELFYGTFGDSLALTSDIEINDDGSADGEDVFAPYYSEATAEHDGQRVITGGGIRYGPDDDYFGESDVNGTEATYDKWEEHLVNEYIDNETEADRHVTNVVHVRQAEQSYTAVIDMRPEQVHRIKAGMVVNHQQLSAAKTLGLQRAGQVQYEPVKPDADGNSLYRVTIELGRPRSRRSILNTRRRPTAKPIPRRPTPSTGDACTRFYLTNDTSPMALAPAIDAGWDDGSPTAFALAETPSASVDGGAFVTLGTTNSDVALYRGAIEVTADLAAILAAGGASIEGHIRARARHGIGVDESVQQHISQISVRVTQGDSTTIRGTALAMHGLTALGDNTNWPAGSVYVNRIFPPEGQSSTLSAVSGAAAGDFLVVEVGYRTFNDAATPHGGGIWVNDSESSDLPSDEVETSDFNSWIDICSSASGGDSTLPTVLPGEETPGEGAGDDDTPTYVGPDHTHAHGLLADDGVHMHDADQIDGLEEFIPDPDSSTPSVTLSDDAPISVTNDATHNAFPGIARMGDGNLILVYRTGTEHAGSSQDGKIVRKISTDDGATWGAAADVANPADDARDPEVTVLKDGTVAVRYVRYDGTADGFTLWLIRSTDNGSTWDTPVQITTTVTVASSAGKIVELPDGDLICPLYGNAAGVGDWSAYLVRSTDGGDTWGSQVTIATGTIGAGSNWTEPYIILMSDGRLLCAIREEDGPDIYTAYSTDDGATWTTPTLQFDGWAKPFLIETAAGAIVCVTRSAEADERAFFTASWDFGATWGDSENLESTGEGMTYASGVQVGDRIIVAYSLEPASTNGDVYVVDLIDVTDQRFSNESRLRVQDGTTDASNVHVIHFPADSVTVNADGSVSVETGVTAEQVKDIGRWEPVVVDEGSGPELVFLDGDIVMHWIDT